MELRVYAMYGNSKTLLKLFVLLTVGEVGFWWTLYGVGDGKVTITHSPIPGVLLCAEGDVPGKHWIVYFYVPVLVIEVLLVALTVIKAWSIYRLRQGNTLVLRLTKQSGLYFVAVSIVYLCHMIFWLIDRLTLNSVILGFSTTIPPILAGRILISLRGFEGDDPNLPSMRSMRFAANREEVSMSVRRTGDEVVLGSIPLSDMSEVGGARSAVAA